MSTFVLSNPQNVTTITAVMNYIDSITQWQGQSILGIMIVGMIFGISFFTLVYSTRRNEEAITASLWITTISGIFLTMMGLLGAQIAVGLIILTALTTVILHRN